MSAPEHLSPVQFSPEQLGQLHTTDFKGPIGLDNDPVGRMERWQSLFGGTGEARHYEEGDSPTKRVEALRADIRVNGVRTPIHAKDWGQGNPPTIYDGHHRAVAAYLEGVSAPVQVTKYDLGGR